MEGISLDFHCFKALNNNLEAQLFYMFIHLLLTFQCLHNMAPSYLQELLKSTHLQEISDQHRKIVYNAQF